MLGNRIRWYLRRNLNESRLLEIKMTEGEHLENQSFPGCEEPGVWAVEHGPYGRELCDGERDSWNNTEVGKGQT